MKRFLLNLGITTAIMAVGLKYGIFQAGATFLDRLIPPQLRLLGSGNGTTKK